MAIKERRLARLRSVDEALLKKWTEAGRATTTYRCHHCKSDRTTRRPRRGDVVTKGYWDSATTCTGCGNLNFVQVWPDGTTESKAIL